MLGAIINSVRQAKSRTDKGKFDDYYYAVLGHYCGDLSMPLHVSVYDDFNRSHHFTMDNTLDHSEVEWDVDGVPIITKEMSIDDRLHFNSEDEIMDYMLGIANESYELANKLRAENRNLTHGEAIQRINRFATFFRALMRYCGKSVCRDVNAHYID